VFPDDAGTILLILGALLTAVWAGWTAIFLHGRLNSMVDLRVVPTWSSNASQVVKLAVEVENIGEIRAGIQGILLSVTPHEIEADQEAGSCIGSEWVDFEKGEYILTSTLWILPKETLHVERLYAAGNQGVLHVGLQIHLEYPWYVELLGSRFRIRRQTRTFYISNSF
jgi:hypothetical protein